MTASVRIYLAYLCLLTWSRANSMVTDSISLEHSDLFVRLQFADGEILMHVFDISYNQLSGPLPSFLDFTNVPEYAQRGIYIAVSLSSACAQDHTSCVTPSPSELQLRELSVFCQPIPYAHF